MALLACLATSVRAATADPDDLASLDLKTLMQMDVMVTAQRHEQSAQNVAAPIDVSSRGDLLSAGVYQPKDLANTTLGLEVGMSGAAPQFFLRGVGDPALDGGSNPGVAFNVDGVYVPRPASTSGQLFDLARIEILKGPQGTLYGRNASAGAINLISNRPDFNGIGGYLNEEVGNYGLTATEAALNLPVNSQLALRGAFQVVSRQGYLSDGKDDDRHRSGRLQALYKPNDAVSLLLGAEYIQVSGHGPGFAYTDYSYQNIGQTAPDPWTGSTSVRGTGLLAAYAARFGLPQFADYAADVSQDNTYWSTWAQLDWNLNFATLTVLPAFTRADNAYPADPAFQINYRETSHAGSLEARLAHQTERVQWVAGIYVFSEDQTFGIALEDAPLTRNISYYDPSTRAYAAFAESTLSLTQQLRLITGLRYTDDQRRLRDGGGESLYPSLVTGCLDLQQPVCDVSSYAGHATFTKTSWKAGLEYDLTPASLLFFTAATGFKAGGLNLAPGAPAFGPENLTAYTLGSRNRFADNRLQLNLEGFLWNYSGAQQPYLTDGFLLVSNVGQARIEGINLDLRAQVTTRDALHLGTEFNHAWYVDFQHPNDGIVSDICSVTPGGLIDCSGAPLDHTARWNAVADWTHEQKLTDGSAITADLTARYIGSHYLEYNLTAGEFAHATTTEDASLSYAPASARWTATAFVRNLTDRAVYSGATVGIIGAPAAVTIGAPRTWGARVEIRF